MSEAEGGFLPLTIQNVRLGAYGGRRSVVFVRGSLQSEKATLEKRSLYWRLCAEPFANRQGGGASQRLWDCNNTDLLRPLISGYYCRSSRRILFSRLTVTRLPRRRRTCINSLAIPTRMGLLGMRFGNSACGQVCFIPSANVTNISDEN